MSSITIGPKGNLKQVISAIDAFTSDDARLCLNAIHVLSEYEKSCEKIVRLVACDGCGMVIVDIEKCLLDYAEKSLWIVKKEHEGKVAYVTPKKVNIDAKDLFPAPNFLTLIPSDLQPCDKNPAVFFDIDNLLRANKLLKVIGTIKNFMPNYVLKNGNSTTAQYYFENGFVILLMPLRTRFSNGIEVCVSPINEYLPGLLPEPVKAEAELETVAA